MIRVIRIASILAPTLGMSMTGCFATTSPDERPHAEISVNDTTVHWKPGTGPVVTLAVKITNTGNTTLSYARCANSLEQLNGHRRSGSI